jgi:hypothetical protein
MPRAIAGKVGTDLRVALVNRRSRDSLRRATAIRVRCPGRGRGVAYQQRTWNPLLQQFASQAK